MMSVGFCEQKMFLVQILIFRVVMLIS